MCVCVCVCVRERERERERERKCVYLKDITFYIGYILKVPFDEKVSSERI